MEIERFLDQIKGETAARTWEGTFQEYLPMVIEDPRLARHAHARVSDMIQWYGAVASSQGVVRYGLFDDSIFGLDRALDRLVQYFRAAATGAEVSRRILLLMGPPASGKSSIVAQIRRGLEKYTRATDGEMYSIKGCPMQEDPLHLIPEDQREQMAREYGLEIEGDLCPRCRYRLTYEYSGNVAMVKVNRIHFSQAQGVGVGIFVATSPQHQELSRLVGSVDMSLFSGDRLEGAGKAFRLDGELEAANRGLMEFIEIFKSDERFLAVMLGVTQERVIKLGGFGLVSSDEVVVGHSNEQEYNDFVANRHTEALLDRLIMVKIPYTLEVAEEVKIYRKLLSTDRPGGVHLAPFSLPIAAVLSVLSRLEPARRGSTTHNVSLLDKLHLYSGLALPPYTAADIDRLQSESSREGMFGISPRYVINRMADAMVRERECLRPIAVLNSLVEGADERAGFQHAERDKLPALLQDAIKEYREWVVDEARRAVMGDFHQQAEEMFGSYIREAERYCSEIDRGDNPPGDKKLLARMEWAVNIREEERPAFRLDIISSYLALVERGETVTYQAIPKLAKAIEAILLPGKPETRSALGVGAKAPEMERLKGVVESGLVENFGYCQACARDLLDYASSILRGKDPVTVRRGRISYI